jgi:adenylate cyclase
LSLFTELKRRNVFRMAGVYLVVAWLAIQIGETVLPIFDTPAWVLKALVALAAIGFLPSLVFSWIFELTPQGLRRDSATAENRSLASETGRRMDLLLALGLVAVMLIVAADRYWPNTSPPAALVTAQDATAPAPTDARSGSAPASGAGAEAGKPSIAVLPFANMSSDADNQYFADGIAEELLNVLAGIDGLKVASRTSSFTFKGKDVPIPEIARELGVAHVLEGSVRRQGERVRITAQLIHAGSDAHLWSKTYDRDLTDIFAVQEEIARAISAELTGILDPAQLTVSAPTAQLAAYERFLRGRARFHQRNELLQANDDLAAAVKLDPQFAEAWVYLAATQSVLPGYRNLGDPGAFAEAEAQKDVSLQHAQRLAPKHPLVLALQGQGLENHGQLVEAITVGTEAANLSTQDSTPVMWLGGRLLRAGYIDEAIVVLERAEQMDPRLGVNLGHLAFAYASAGRAGIADARARTATELGWNLAEFNMALDRAALGERETAAQTLSSLRRGTLPPESQAGFDAYLASVRDPTRAVYASGGLLNLDILFNDANPGDRDVAYWLRSAWLPGAGALREDPEFFSFADRYGLVKLWETRGYPPGCQRVKGAAGDHLDCAGMHRR